MIATFTFKPRSWNLSGLNGISDATVETHFGLYEGYVKNTNLLREQLSEMLERGKPTGLDPRFAELQRRLGFELGGMRLHELYFDNLTTKQTELIDGGGLHSGMLHVWGSVAKWRSEFCAMGEMRGVGWVILAQDPWSGDFSNHWVELHQDGNIPGFVPILVMDVWEHAWIKDYAPKARASYVEAFLSNVDWHLCEENGCAPCTQRAPRRRRANAHGMASSSARALELGRKLRAFMNEVVYPNERRYEEEVAAAPSRFFVSQVMEEMKAKARAAGLWNLFLPEEEYGAGLSNAEYAPLCEIMGRSHVAPEVFNCNAPDTGNMETLVRYGNDEQKKQWLEPLLRGEIRSGFAMTEPDVASSDATNIAARIDIDGDHYVINGRKWWTTNGNSPRCKILIFMGKTDPSAATHLQQSMILVPMDTPGVKVERSLSVFGFDDAPHGHGELSFTNVRVPRKNVLLGEGRGFEIAQGRLGPGRIHHCMRAIGLAERALEAMCERARSRKTFGKMLAEQGVVMEWIANSRMEIDQARLLTMTAAEKMDAEGNKAAQKEIAMIKVVAPNMLQNVLDRAIQTHGGAGVCQDYFLARAWTYGRTMRIFDGPDEVHRRHIARLELKKYGS